MTQNFWNTLQSFTFNDCYWIIRKETRKLYVTKFFAQLRQLGEWWQSKTTQHRPGIGQPKGCDLDEFPSCSWPKKVLFSGTQWKETIHIIKNLVRALAQKKINLKKRTSNGKDVSLTGIRHKNFKCIHGL